MLAACVQCRQKKKLPISVPTTTLKRVGNTRAKTSPWVISCLKQQISFLLFHSSCEIQLVFIFSVCFYHYYFFFLYFWFTGYREGSFAYVSGSLCVWHMLETTRVRSRLDFCPKRKGIPTLRKFFESGCTIHPSAFILYLILFFFWGGGVWCLHFPRQSVVHCNPHVWIITNPPCIVGVPKISSGDTVVPVKCFIKHVSWWRWGGLVVLLMG